MNTFVLLMGVTLVGVAALFIALALFVRSIVRELEHIGGPATRFVRPTNYLAKIRLGLRAIETQTAPIGPALRDVNDALEQAAGTLGSLTATNGNRPTQDDTAVAGETGTIESGSDVPRPGTP